MTPELLLRAMLRLQHGARPDATRLCTALLQRMAPTQAVIAAVRPHSRLEQRLRRLLPPERLCLLERVPVQAGIDDSDIPPSADLPWPHPSRPGARVRRLDTLFPDPRHVALIVIDDAAGAPALLQGATNLVKTVQPAIVFDFAAVPPAERQSAWEATVGCLPPAYTWFDGLLMPCEGPAEIFTTLGDAVICTLPHAAQSPLATLAAGGWRPALPPAAPIDPIWVGECDADLPSVGLYAPEGDCNHRWRWSGPDPACYFFLPLPGPGRWEIALDIADWGSVAGAEFLLVSADDQKLSFLGQHDEWQRFGHYDAVPLKDTGRLRIDLVTPRPQVRPGDDPRAVGIAVHGIKLTRIDGAETPHIANPA
jgi:hypothetical protein